MATFTVSESTLSTFWTFVSADLFEAMTELIFYGILLVLVAFASVLLYRRPIASNRVLSVSTVVMFILATVQLAARLRSTTAAFRLFYLAMQGELVPQSAVANKANGEWVDSQFVEDVLLVTNDLVADGVLIYRCWFIWERNYKVIILPSLMLFVTTVLSYLSAYQGDYPSAGGPTVDLRFGFALGLLTNIVIVGLTASRIWMTRAKAVSRNVSDTTIQRYNTALAMVLESGAIICAWTIAYVITRSLCQPPVWRIFRGGLAQLLNIGPILIVVRVGLSQTLRGRSTSTSTSGTTVSDPNATLKSKMETV
ncbi:hypothetical protein FB45DRAFT_152455 [Roridomyces roridus]|uniref:Uncharacterized protein n=1 Tax=Roridomyces roridus TaxID=1738132 RepID=A0AAD7F5S2_9AGAR|nr:hypothetical protein FB45DRAFT_152455 [Roridomyces roridus]